MDSVAAKRQKMSKMSEPTQTSSEIQKIDPPDPTISLYEEHYNSPYYIDKTLLIEKLMIDHHALITAPSRFGKTLNMDMAIKFFEIELNKENQPIVLNRDNNGILEDVQPESENFKLFKNKNIFNNKKLMSEHFGQYPVIYVDFGGVAGDSFEEIIISLRAAIHNAFVKHDYLLESSLWKNPKCEKEIFMRYCSKKQSESLTPGQIECGLEILAKYLYHYYGKEVYVFIDEFDVPVNSMIHRDVLDPNVRGKLILLLQKLIKALLKANNRFVEKSLCNACQQLGDFLLFSANNIQHYPFMKPHIFTEFYGFSVTEIEKLLKKVEKPELLEKIKNHYKGYQVKFKNGRVNAIYSPWVVTQYVKTGILSNQ